MPLILPFRLLFKDLFERQSNKGKDEREREGERERLSTQWFTPQMTSSARSGPMQNLETGTPTG